MSPKSEFERRGLLGGLIALPLVGCAGRLAPRATAPRAGLTLATFNIWHDAGGQWPARLDLIVAALRAADPDVIALQEVLQDASKGLPNQAETIAQRLGYPYVFFVGAEPETASKRYGNAIISRLPVVDVARRKLEPLDDYRTAIRVRVQKEGKPIDVIATHLAWQPEAAAVRAAQIADLLHWLPDDGVPALLMGDFNAPLDDRGLDALTPRFTSALPPKAVVTTLNPAHGHDPRVIDHIFAESTAFDIRNAHIIGDRPVNGLYPSDHFGVVAQISLR